MTHAVIFYFYFIFKSVRDLAQVHQTMSCCLSSYWNLSQQAVCTHVAPISSCYSELASNLVNGNGREPVMLNTNVRGITENPASFYKLKRLPSQLHDLLGHAFNVIPHPCCSMAWLIAWPM